MHFITPIRYINFKLRNLYGVKVFDLYKWWRGLTQAERKDFCRRAKVGFRYMDNHLVHRNKNPSIKTLDAIVKNSSGQITHKDLIEYFIVEKPKTATQISN